MPPLNLTPTPLQTFSTVNFPPNQLLTKIFPTLGHVRDQKFLLQIINLILLGLLLTPVLAREMTSNEVYIETYLVNEEIKLLKQHLHIDKSAEIENVNLPLSSGHNWQKGYEILYKINLFRQKQGLLVSSVSSREPLLELSSAIVYEQVQRILTELKVIKQHVGISEQVVQPPVFTNKNSVDVYNLLNQISQELDILNGSPVSPSDAFAQAVRITEDVDFILEALHIPNDSIPPPKIQNTKPADVYEVVLQLLVEIRRLQKQIGISGLDFSTLKPKHRTITPSDVFSLDSIVLTELQPLKAHLGLKHALTPIAQHYENIQPASPHQLHGWTLRKLKLIRTLDNSK